VTAAYRSSRITALHSGPTIEFDEFVAELWSCEEDPFRLVIQCHVRWHLLLP
jgi:hypothetical protein